MKTYKDVQTIGRWQRWSRWLGVPLVLVLALGALLLATPTATVVRADIPFTYTVNSAADTGGSCLTLPTCTLRQAINESNAYDPGAGNHNTIIFAAAVTGTITLANGPLTLTRDVVITGPGARVLTVTGRPSFMVNAGVTASISGLTISGAGYNLTNYGIENNGTLTVTNSTFTDNTYGIGNQGTLTVTSSTFSNNTKGIINPSGTMTVTNSTFSGNSDDGIVSDGTLTVTNSTLSRNGAGIVNNGGTLTVKNSIVALNDGEDNIFGSFTDGGHNLTSGDPKLGSLADNGGPTNTLLLLPGSPALDAGGTAANGCPPTDQRGITRPQRSACDIGAVELVPSGLAFVVSSTADTDGSCPTVTTCTLRQAVNGSNAYDPGAGKQNTITFAAGVTGTITRVNGPLTLTRNVAITVPGPGALAVTGPAANFGVNAGVTASISGLTFTESCLGIVNMSGTLTVTNSTFSGNTGANCAGIFNDGTLTVTNSTFTNNYKGIDIDSGTVTVTNSTFSGNTGALGGNASAGIQNQGTLTVTNSTLSGNTTGIINFDTLTVRNSIIAGNIGPNIVSSFTDGGHNLIGGDPKLGPLANNGGPTKTLLLLPGSPALNAGGTAANGCPATDQRGVTRPQGYACDIGAVEVAVAPGRPLALVVSNTADTGGSCPTVTTCTLRQAVNGSNENQPGADQHNTITFAAGVTGTITLGNALTLTRDVAITGPGARVLAVAGEADHGGLAVNAGVTASISGLTISGASFADIENAGTLTVTDSTFNSTSTDSIINSGTLTVTSSTFSGNANNFFGTTGITNIKSNSTLTVTNSTVSGKSVGIKNNGTLTMTNSTVSGNTGGIQNQATLTVRNSIVAGNTGANIQGDYTDGGHNLTSGNPKLGPLANNGGPTKTLLLLPGSPALNAGGTAANGCPATDQRGITRPQGYACDIGAVEVAVTGLPLRGRDDPDGDESDAGASVHKESLVDNGQEGIVRA